MTKKTRKIIDKSGKVLGQVSFASKAEVDKKPQTISECDYGINIAFSDYDHKAMCLAIQKLRRESGITIQIPYSIDLRRKLYESSGYCGDMSKMKDLINSYIKHALNLEFKMINLLMALDDHGLTEVVDRTACIINSAEENNIIGKEPEKDSQMVFLEKEEEKEEEEEEKPVILGTEKQVIDAIRTRATVEWGETWRNIEAKKKLLSFAERAYMAINSACKTVLVPKVSIPGENRFSIDFSAPGQVKSMEIVRKPKYKSNEKFQIEVYKKSVEIFDFENLDQAGKTSYYFEF